MNNLAVFAFVFYTLGPSLATAAERVSQMQKIEERLKALDKERGGAEVVLLISKEMEKIVYERIRLTGAGGSAEKKFWKMRLDYCQREAGWRTQFAKLEADLKKTNGGLLPQWAKENRDWQKLDAAMKKDTISVRPEECKKIYEKKIAGERE